MTRSIDAQSNPGFGKGFDLTDPALLAQGLPVEEFARLRKTAPVWWVAQDPDRGGGFHDGGYWAITKHAHIREISRDPETWSSHLNGSVMRYTNDVPPEEIEAAKALMHNSDPPGHTRLRKLISRLFTPRSIAHLEDGLRATARQIVSAAAGKADGDFVIDVAHRLPLNTVANLVGFPEEDHDRLFHWANVIMSAEDPELEEDPKLTMMALMGYSYEVAADRKKNPGDDIISRLLAVDENGDSLTEIEFGYFMLLLITAGTETTRNAISIGMLAMLEHPEQWELYKRTRPSTAIEEIIRWASPVNAFQRTSRRDTNIGGIQIKQGQRVGLFYGSGNYDEDVFVEPFRFDIRRDPNPHLGFGGNGPHFCLGANLARMQLTIMFDTIADRLPEIESAGAPTRQYHGTMNGIVAMPVRYHAR
ncbi:MAG TPA: cytochrome P450 [Mycobacterium sp.]|nr:cytochrome P450 [Mycobacterium sp.]